MLYALILYVSGETYSLTSTPNDRFLRNFYIACLLFSEILPEISKKEIAEGVFFHILFWCLTCDTNPGFMSNKPKLYLLDYGDF